MQNVGRHVGRQYASTTKQITMKYLYSANNCKACQEPLTHLGLADNGVRINAIRVLELCIDAILARPLICANADDVRPCTACFCSQNPTADQPKPAQIPAQVEHVMHACLRHVITIPACEDLLHIRGTAEPIDEAFGGSELL